MGAAVHPEALTGPPGTVTTVTMTLADPLDPLAVREAALAELSRAPEHIDLARRVLVFDDEEVSFDVLVSSIPLPMLSAVASVGEARSILPTSGRQPTAAWNAAQVGNVSR